MATAESFLLQLIIYLSTISCFSYQTWHILDEYLKYPTTTFVTLENVPKVTLPPRVGFRVLYKLNPGRTVKSHFDKINDTTKLVESAFRISEAKSVRKKVVLNAFFRSPDYYISLAAKNRTEYTPEHLYTERREMYSGKIKSNLFEAEDNGITLTFFLKPYYGDLEGVQKTDALVNCPTNNNRSTCDIRFTYSTKITKLAPAPYDTDCRDYHKMGFTSNENCLSECLTNFTEKHGYLIATNVIPREKYRNSSHVILHWLFRKLKTGPYQLTQKILKQEVNMTKNPISKKWGSYWADLFPSYKGHHDFCMSLCGKQDCSIESLIPKVLMAKDTGEKSSKLEFLHIRVYPSDDQVLVVTSKAKLTVLDVIVYLLSSTSFWFGFCPLSLSRLVKSKTRKSGKRRLPTIQKLCHQPEFQRMLIVRQLALEQILERTRPPCQ